MGGGCVLLLAAVLAVGTTADWSDCPSPCRCKWASGKKTASCRDGPLVALPDALDADMQVLDVSGNAIRQLGRAAFERAGLINLQRIFMRRNRLRAVHADAFSALIILVELDLADNELEALAAGAFAGAERLRVLTLSGNPIRELVAAQFPVLPHLRTVDLAGCHLVRVDPAAFAHLAALESVSLRANRLRALAETAFMGLPRLKALALDGNPWRCDCELRAFRDWYLSGNLRSSAPLACAAPPEVAARRWADVAGARFACAPQVALAPHPPHVQVEAGANVTLGCRVRGDPEPAVSWLYDGRPLAAAGHAWLTLEAEEGLLDKWVNVSVANVSDADAGVYTCVARTATAAAAANVTVALPEVVTATTRLSNAGAGVGAAGGAWWWAAGVGGGGALLGALVCVAAAGRRRRRRRPRCRHLKPSVSFTDQEKKLLDVSTATTTATTTMERSCEALPLPAADGERHLPMAVYPLPPPAEFSGGGSGGSGIYISFAVSRDHHHHRQLYHHHHLDTAGCPDLLDLPHRVATLPRRPQPASAAPKYDNMGPRVTAGGSSTLSLPDAAAGELLPQASASGRPLARTSPEFVSL